MAGNYPAMLCLRDGDAAWLDAADDRTEHVPDARAEEGQGDDDGQPNQ